MTQFVKTNTVNGEHVNINVDSIAYVQTDKNNKSHAIVFFSACNHANPSQLISITIDEVASFFMDRIKKEAEEMEVA